MAKSSNYFIKGDVNAMKWYEKGWVIFLLLLFIFPVGVFLLWKCGHWRKPIKVIATVVFAFIFVGAIFGNTPNEVDVDISTEANEPIENINHSEENKPLETPEPTKVSEPEENSESTQTSESVTEPVEIPESEPTPEVEPESEIQMTELFENVYLPYVRKEKSSIFEGVKTFAENCSYRVEVTEPTDEILGKIKFYDENNNSVYIGFIPEDGFEVIMTVSYIQASSNAEVSYSTQFDEYNMHIIGSSRQKVSGVDEQIKFLFQQ